MSPQVTQPGRLSEVARRLVLPTGLAATEWPSIKARTRTMGIHFDQWQADLVRGALAKRKDGKYAATVGGVVWSLPRQVGKTFTVGAMLFAYCIEHPGALVLWTAHHTRTSGETFRSMQGMALKPRIAPHVENVYTGSGTESVVFKNGARILFGARDQGFGLGFAAVDVVVFDEAQLLSDRTRQDMVPATNRSHNPAGALLFYIGTPPRPESGVKGEAFAALRAAALQGDDDSTFYVELSADPDADPDDREQWAKANPSFPHHTPVESMLRMRKHLGSDEAWRREALGIWDAVAGKGVLPAPSWTEAADERSVPADRFALGVECGPDLAYASVSLAGQRADDDWHFELEMDQHIAGSGTAWLVPHIEGLLAANPEIRAVMVDVAGPIAALLEKRPDGRWFFKGTKVEATAITVAELGAACSLVLDGIVTGWLHHIGQPQFTAAALSAGKRALGDTGKWVWSRKTSTSDITPIQAGTLALAGAQKTKVKRPSKRTSSGRVVILS